MPRARRGLTWALVAAVAMSGLLGVEAWPLTGWRLFSRRRGPVVVSYEARAVGAAGDETPIAFASLPHAYSGSDPILHEMARQAPAAREAVCTAWARATAHLAGLPVAEVRVYEVAHDLRTDTRRNSLAWTCGRAAP